MFRGLVTALTSGPYDLAICTAKVPTPPEAPLIRIVYSGRISPWWRSPCSAVTAAKGDTGKEGLTAHGMPVRRIDRHGQDLHQHLIGARCGLLQLRLPKNPRRPILLRYPRLRDPRSVPVIS
jgi:hypothetical protein